MHRFSIRMRTGLLAGVVLLAGGSWPAFPAGVVMIANAGAGVSEASSEDVKLLFLGSKSALGSSGRLEPVILKGGPAHEEFLKTYVGKTDTAFRNHFKSLVFTGKSSMPKSFNSDEDVIGYVGKTSGAIGYVGAAATLSGVKAVAVK